MNRNVSNVILTAMMLTVITGSAAAWGKRHTSCRHHQVRGVVFLDKNENGTKERFEPGIPGVVVSNGKEVAITGPKGGYALPAYDEMIVFISKPAGYDVPLNENNMPKFYYIHQPSGSPDYIQEFPGIAPTGPLPRFVNFPLLTARHNEDDESFSSVMIGDTQVYSDDEIGHLRETLVKEIATYSNAAFALSMGDNIGDNLSLYPRYLKVMSGMNKPLYLVPGNHDMNFDAEDPAYAFETFKLFAGPTYYSFNYGKVHFVVLNSIVYPSPIYTDYKTYHGEIDERQMTWLENDLAHVPQDHLVVLNMHIPVVSYQDRMAAQHQVANREALYALLKGRKALTLGGHTHTLEHFLPGDEMEGWGQPTPIPQIIVGAACGSWWSGDLDEDGVPFSYQRDGAPRGYDLFSFNGNTYEDTYKATGKSILRQINASFYTPSFDVWYDALWGWLNEDVNTRSEAPPVTINDLPDQGIIAKSMLPSTTLVANVWGGSSDSEVYCNFDGTASVVGKRAFDIGDPYALRMESYVFRYAAGFTLFGDAVYGTADPQPLEAWLHTQTSPHVWTCEVPDDLDEGIHRVRVVSADMFGKWHQETKAFEVVADAE